MYQALGLLFVLSLPILVILFARSNISTKPTKKSKKKKKKNKSKSTAAQSSNDSPPSVAPSVAASPPSPKETPTSPSQTNTSSSSKSKRKQANKSKAAPVPTPEPKPVATTPPSKQQPTENASAKKSTEVDEHMDWTPKYSRVMRITREPEEESFQPVPHEDGWNSVTVKKPLVPSSSSSRVVDNEPLTKKQRENQARAAKKREAKAQADALQAERLRRHQRELEKRRIEEFYSTGAGKHTPWGKKPQRGSSKVPTAKAGLNEHGQLIWD